MFCGVFFLYKGVDILFEENIYFFLLLMCVVKRGYFNVVRFFL